MIIAETPKLILREYTPDDTMALYVILSDVITMQFWPAPFTAEAAAAWLDRQLKSYAQHGYGRWAVIDKASGELIGDAGFIQANVNGRDEIDLGYIIHHPYWRQGYAYAAAGACLEHARASLPIDRVVANMPYDHIASKRVAEKLGMRYEGEFLNPRNRNIRTLLYAIDLHSAQKTSEKSHL